MTICTKTTRFPTIDCARRALLALQRKHPERHERGVHPCAFHHCWHLTHLKGYPNSKRVRTVGTR